MRRWRSTDPATIAGLFVVWAVAWSIVPGRIAEDTKNDLYVDAWGFMARSLHLWDPQVTWGGLSNQGYGYLFPMGPFFALGSEVAPVWVVQRLWWSVLLSAGLLGTAGLLKALGVGSARTRMLGALAYVLAPRVVTTIAGLSAESLPQLMAPMVLWPLVLAARGRMSNGRAATLSGIAALCCGGVNATATLCALLPAGIWLVTRHRWWRSGLTWQWAAAVVAASAWWLGPLLVMARYSPPFLDWIENAQAVNRPVGMLDVIRGTTHWLGHVVTPGGAWWPAGHELVSRPALIILTSLVAAMGLAGLALAVPERRWAWTCLLAGGVVLTIAHRGPFDSPLVNEVQSLFDGSLAPFRNVHKFDLLIRLPMVVGLTHVLGLASQWRPRRAWQRSVTLAVAAVTIIAAAAPAFTGAVAVRGTFEGMPQHWIDAGRWLDAQDDRGALVVPAANFGEYRWGRTIDEPLRPLTDAAYAVRDAVPIAPAGTIRLLDEIERRLQTGRSIGGGADVLRRAGVSYLVVRNDLSPQESGQPPVALARAAVRATPGVTFVKGFGSSFLDAVGERVSPVEIYSIPGQAASDLELWSAARVRGASGASENLSSLADAGLLDAPVIFDGDRTADLVPSTHIETDGYRLRQRWFGATRGQDLTTTLTRTAGSRAPDYLPWSDEGLHSAVDYEGIAGISASSSMAEDLTFGGLRPAARPFAAVDGNSDTAWAAMWDSRPTLTIDLSGPLDLHDITITGLDRGDTLSGTVVRPSRLLVTTDVGSVSSNLGTGPTRVTLPDGMTTRVSIAILGTVRDSPGQVVTGLSEVALPGVKPREVVTTPSTTTPASQTVAMVLGAGLGGRDGCTTSRREFVCLSGESVDAEQTGGMTWLASAPGGGTWTAGGTLTVGSKAPSVLMESPGVSVSASSVRNSAPQASPQAIVDGDDRTAWSPAFDDETPQLTFDFGTDVTISTLRFQTRRDWASTSAPAVVIDVGGKEFTRRIQKGGIVTIPATAGRQLRLEIVSVPGANSSPAAALELEAVQIAGHEFTPPAEHVQAPCGQGPALVVDGKDVPTRASVKRDAIFGVGSATWTACAPVELNDTRVHRVAVSSWLGLTASTTVLRRETVLFEASPEVVPAGQSGAEWSGRIEPQDSSRLLVMTQNASTGWEARLGGERLVPQVVDGRRQGFVVPAGRGGELHIGFAPDSTYRTALALGLGLALLLITASVLTMRSKSGRRVRADRLAESTQRVGVRGGLRPVAGTLATAAVGLVVAGPFGAIAATLGALLSLGLRPRVRAGVVASLIALCGLTQAVLAPGSLGGTAVEGSIRLVLLAAVALAASLSWTSSVSENPGREA